MEVLAEGESLFDNPFWQRHPLKDVKSKVQGLNHQVQLLQEQLNRRQQDLEELQRSQEASHQLINELEYARQAKQDLLRANTQLEHENRQLWVERYVMGQILGVHSQHDGSSLCAALAAQVQEVEKGKWAGHHLLCLGQQLKQLAEPIKDTPKQDHAKTVRRLKRSSSSLGLRSILQKNSHQVTQHQCSGNSPNQQLDLLPAGALSANGNVTPRNIGAPGRTGSPALSVPRLALSQQQFAPDVAVRVSSLFEDGVSAGMDLQHVGHSKTEWQGLDLRGCQQGETGTEDAGMVCRSWRTTSSGVYGDVVGVERGVLVHPEEPQTPVQRHGQPHGVGSLETMADVMQRVEAALAHQSLSEGTSGTVSHLSGGGSSEEWAWDLDGELPAMLREKEVVRGGMGSDGKIGMSGREGHLCEASTAKDPHWALEDGLAF